MIKRSIGVIILLLIIQGCFGIIDKKDEYDPDKYWRDKGYTVIDKNGRKIDIIWEKKIEETVACDNHSETLYNGDIIAVGTTQTGFDSIERAYYIVRFDKNGEIKWRVKDKSFKKIDSPRELIEGKNLFTFGKNNIAEYDVETGQLVSNTVLPDNISFKSSRCSYYENNMYFIGYVKNIDNIIETKLYEWSYQEKKILRSFPIQDLQEIINGTDINIQNGIIYFGIEPDGEKNGKFIAFNILNWNIEWSYEIKSFNPQENIYKPRCILGNIFVDNKKVIFPTSEGNICLNKENGEVIWNGMRNGENGTDGIVGDILYNATDSKMYFLTSKRNNFDDKLTIDEHDIFCIDMNCGKIIWSKATINSLVGTPALKNGKLYVPADVIMVFNALDGSYYSGLSSNFWTKSIAASDGVIYLFGIGGVIAMKSQ